MEKKMKQTAIAPTAPELASNYESACNAYLLAFCEKHELDFSPSAWIGGRVGEIAEVSDFYVGMSDIRTDIDTLCEDGEFFDWYNYSVRAGTLGVVTPNFDQWLRKCPTRSEEELKKMEATRAEIERLEDELKRMVENG